MNRGGSILIRMRVRAVVAISFVLAATQVAATPAPSRGRTPRPAARASAERPDVISLDLKDVDIRDVLRTFAELEHFNLMIDPEVRGSVTVRLENVRWQDALEVILRSNGLGWMLSGNVVRTAPVAKLAADP